MSSCSKISLNWSSVVETVYCKVDREDNFGIMNKETGLRS